MSFWNGLVKAIDTVLEKMKENQETINEYKERLSVLDDDALLRKYKHSIGAEKYACVLLINERRCGPETEE